jgi:hypothetical protein
LCLTMMNLDWTSDVVDCPDDFPEFDSLISEVPDDDGFWGAGGAFNLELEVEVPAPEFKVTVVGFTTDDLDVPEWDVTVEL